MPPRRTPPAARVVHFAGLHPTAEQHAEVLQSLQPPGQTPVDSVDSPSPPLVHNGEAAVPHSPDSLVADDTLLPSGAGIASSPNPFLSPPIQLLSPPVSHLPDTSSIFASPDSLNLIASPPPGLHPDQSATPPQPQPTSIASDLQSATQYPGPNSPNEGTLPPSTPVSAGLTPASAPAIALGNPAPMLNMPAPPPSRDAPPSNPTSAIDRGNLNISTLDAGHIFDAIFTDMPSLAWLRPAWIDHDLTGQSVLHLQPTHLADVLVDLELSSSRYIQSRHQKLSIARAIYRLIAADHRSSPNNVAAWDSYSLTLPPITSILAHVTSAVPSRDMAWRASAPGTVTNPVTLLTPPVTPSIPGMPTRPIVLDDSLNITPQGTIVLSSTPSSAPPIARMQPPSHVLFPPLRQDPLSPPAAFTAPDAPHSSVRTRSVAAETIGYATLVTHDPSSHLAGELMVELSCGTKIYKDKPTPQQTLHYPMLFNFDRESWEIFIIKYRREHIIAHKLNQIPIIQRIDPGIIRDVIDKLKIDPSTYFAVPNATMERDMFQRFGPETPSLARYQFCERVFKFDDTYQHQSIFADKLARYLREKSELLLDYVHVEKAKWKANDDFTHSMLIEALIKCFPPSPLSSNNDYIAQAIRDHRTKSLHEIASILDEHFTNIDRNVARGEGSYHVFPTKTKFKRDRDGIRTPRDGGNTKDSRDGGNRLRNTSRDGGGAAHNAFDRQRTSNTHERGICGNRQHTCSATTCLFWGESEAKPANYAWGTDEKSVSVPLERYQALKSAKPHIVPPLKASPSSGRGKPIPHGNTGRGLDLHRGGSRGSRGGRGSSPYRGGAHSVNDSRYESVCTAAAAATPHENAPELQHVSFYAVARINRQHMARTGRCTRTLMDTGANAMNIIRSSIVDSYADSRAAIDIVSRRINCSDLTNNGKVIGRSTEEVRLSFTLDTLPGIEPTTYTEWFYMFDDLQDEMVLGSTFNRANGFSTYHVTLVEWDGIQCPQPPRHRDRVVNPRERLASISKALSHSTRDLMSCTKYPGTGVPIIRRPACHGVQHYPLPDNVTGKTPGRNDTVFHSSPVNYDCVQSVDLARHLARSFASQRTVINKKVNANVSGAAHSEPSRMSEQDLEALLDSSKHAARDAEEFYYSNAHLLDKRFDKPGATLPQNKRYFMDGWVPPAKAETSAQPTFSYGHTAVLQGLCNFACLNDCPARILNFDSDTCKYTIHVASERAPTDMRGYWLCAEANLRSADPIKPPRTGPITAATADLADMGIDHESGNPTLEPEQRPIHRQFGKEVSIGLTEKIRLLKEKYKVIFSTDIRQPCKFRPMGIQLIPNAILPRSPRFWKNSPEMRNEVRKQLQKLLADNVVIPSTTSIVSNVLLVKRPGMPGKFRFTVDLRQVNQATVPVKWCMPDVQNQLDRLKGCTIFGALDISQYYHQIELEIGSQYLTGFITEDGVYQYQRVPMGLTSACAWAQQELQKAIDADATLVKYNVRNYFDDIPLGAKNEEDFLEVLEALLALCQRFNLKINAEKSIFGVDSITHVGFIVDADGARVDPMRTQSFRDMATPSSVKGVQAVLGAMNYVRHFVPNFSVRAKPLTDLVGGRKKGERATKFIWTEAAQLAFDDLKEAVTNTTPLAFLDYAKEIFIRCDSSQFGAGAVIFQFDELGREQPIAYASRKYTIAERNYNTFQQEASVIVWSLEKFAEFFQGHAVTVQSDHRNLAWIKRSAMPQLTRWRIRLQDFDFKIEYLPGPQQICADGLSRLGCDDKDLQITMGDFLPTNAAAISLLNSPIPLRALNCYGKHIPGRAPTAAEIVWNDLHADIHAAATEPTQPDINIADDGDMLPSELSDGDDQQPPLSPSHAFGAINGRRAKRPLSAPPPLADAPTIPNLDHQDVEHLLHQAHSDIVGHAGVFVTLQRALTANKGGWANRAKMIADVDAFISGCPCCQKFRKRRTQGAHRFVIEGSPFAELSIDILKLPRADCHDCKYVVVIVDSFTRWTHCVAVEDKSALSAARALLQTVGIFGVPLSIRSDGGGEFINDVLKALEHVLGTSHHKVSPYLHTGNSLAEKANRSILENLRNLIFDKRLTLHGEHQWSDLLPLAQRIINSSFNSSIGCSPASLLFGENVDLDRCLLRVQPPPTSNDPTDYVNQLSHNQHVLLDAASLHLDAVHAANIAKWKAGNRSSLKLQAAVQIVPLSRAVEEGAWALARILADAPHDKLKPRWAGPFRLLDFKSASQSTVRLWDTVGKRLLEAHINDVELWNPLFEQSTEGLTKIAETDGWSYPISAILAIALKPADDDDEPLALPPSHKRTKAKHAYLVSVQWQGYAEPSWVPLLSVEDTSIFQLWHPQRPLLRL